MIPSTEDSRSNRSGASDGRNNAASTRELFCWALFDWANSAFPTVIQTFLFAAYFTRQVAADTATGTAQWGNAISIAGLLVALGGPVLGAVTDQTGRRKPWIAAFTAVCVAATALLWFVEPSTGFVWPALVLVGLGTVGVEYAVILYNAMLPDLAGRDEVGRWSGWAWSLGYAGGLACLFVALTVFVGMGDGELAGEEVPAGAVRNSVLLVAGWYLLFAVPMLLFTRDAPRTDKALGRAVRDAFGQLAESVRHVRRHRHVVRFLVARMLYIDGLATLFALGGVYAAGTFGMNERDILKFGIALNVTAGLGAFGFGWVDDWIGGKRTIVLSLVGLIIPATAVLLVGDTTLSWVFCLIVGIFVGPVQAASRSFLSRVVPRELQNQTFGLYALSGKATAFVGPLLVGWITYGTGSQRAGMSAIVVLFGLGLLLMVTVPRDE